MLKITALAKSNIKLKTENTDIQQMSYCSLPLTHVRYYAT